MNRTSRISPIKKAGKYTTATLSAALRATGGKVYLAARQLGCAPKTIYNRIAAEPALAQLLDEVREETIDLAESKLLQLIREAHLSAIIFYLKTQAKHRGYVERQGQTGAGGGPVQTQTKKKMDVASIDAEIERLFERARRRQEQTERQQDNGSAGDGNE